MIIKGEIVHHKEGRHKHGNVKEEKGILKMPVTEPAFKFGQRAGPSALFISSMFLL